MDDIWLILLHLGTPTCSRALCSIVPIFVNNGPALYWHLLLLSLALNVTKPWDFLLWSPIVATIEFNIDSTTVGYHLDKLNYFGYCTVVCLNLGRVLSGTTREVVKKWHNVNNGCIGHSWHNRVPAEGWKLFALFVYFASWRKHNVICWHLHLVLLRY